MNNNKRSRPDRHDKRRHAPVETGHDYRSAAKPDPEAPKAPDGISGYF